MEYMVKKRYHKKGINGREWNLPYAAQCESSGNVITYDGIPVCATTSQDAYDYFVRDDDKEGTKRAGLIDDIQRLLAKQDDDYQTRWDRVWDDPRLERFKRKEHKDYWLWNHDFYNADIDDLTHILATIQGGE